MEKMGKEEFVKILKEAGVPPECHDAWWIRRKNDNGSFSLSYNKELLLLNAKMIVKKGCATSAPW